MIVSGRSPLEGRLARPSSLSALAALLLACSGEPEPEPVDTGWASEGTLDLRLGTGEADWTPIVDGQTLDLESGSQGLQHVVLSLRSTTLPAGRHITRLTLLEGEEVRVEPPQVTAEFFALGEAVVAPGLLLVIAEPDAVLGRELSLRAEIQQAFVGDIGRDERAVRIEWPRGAPR